MEKLGEESAAKFINALIKSVQTLCHGYLDFQNGVEIIGHINLNVDKGSSLDYILKEKVCKNAENSTLFISNSFHAEPKPDQDVSGKTSQSGNQVAQNNESSDAAETGRVSSAISSISTALTESRERLRRNSGARDSNSFHSLPNTAKRKASEEENSECHPAKISYHDRLSHVTSESSYPAETSSPIDSKEALLALRTAESDLSETVLPQTASVRSDGSDIGVNLAGSVLEPVEGQLNADLPEREEDSDGDLEVTFIKEEYVEGEGSACDFDGQQFASGQHQRGSDGMPDPSLFSMGPQSSSAPATYVPSAAGQQFPVSGSSSSASQPQPGPSGMRGLWGTCSDRGKAERTVGQASHLTPHPHRQTFYESIGPQLATTSHKSLAERFSLLHPRQFPLNCLICGKGIFSAARYRDHMNMHNNIKVHKCPFCFKRFTFKSDVTRHIRNGVCNKHLLHT